MPAIHLMLRVSSDPQEKGKGWEVQEIGTRDYISRHEKYKTYDVKVYKEIQGSFEPEYLKDRPDLMNLLDNLKTGDIPAFWNQERLARNESVYHDFIRELRHKGIDHIIFSDGVVSISSKERWMGSVKASMTHLATEEMIEKSCVAKKKYRGEGKFVGHALPYGYKAGGEKRGRVYLVEMKKAEIYRWIVLLLLQGYNSAKIADFLNGWKIKPPSSGYEYEKYKGNSKKFTWKKVWGVWRGTSISYMLSNPFYCGKLKVEGEYIQGKHKPLITEAKWNQVQQILTSMKKVIRKGPPITKDIVGRDVFVCGICGTKLVGKIEFVRRKSKPDHFWKRYCCPTCRGIGENAPLTRKRPPEGLPLMDMDSADSVLWGKVKYLIKHSDKLKVLVKDWIDNRFVNKVEDEANLKRLEKDIKDYERAKLKLLDYVASGGWTEEEIKAKGKEYQANIDQMKVAYNQIHDRVHGETKMAHTLASIEPLLNKLSLKIDKLPKSQWNEYIRLCVDRVVVDYEEERFSFKFEGVLDIYELAKTDCESQVLS